FALCPLPSFLVVLRRPPISTLFPYTTLFRSVVTPSVASPMAGQYFIIRNGRDVVSGARFPSELGVRATDARTLVIELESPAPWLDRKSTRLNSSHVKISYAVFCLKKKKRRDS